MRKVLLLSIIGMLFNCTNVKTDNNQTILEKSDSSVVTKQSRASDTVSTKSAELSGYDELSNENNYDTFKISEYNTDIQSIPNIDRPTNSTIKDFKFSTKNFFGIWVHDTTPETRHATFQITKHFFYMVDYDGNSDMSYEVDKDSITVYFNDFIKRGRIIDAGASDSIIIHWNNSEKPSTYYKWKY